MLHTNKFLMITGLILSLFVLAGCTREVVTEVVVTATPGPANTGSAAPPSTAAVAGAPSDTGSDASTVAPTPAPATAPASVVPTEAGDTDHVYQIGIAADLTTTNYWAYLGPDGTIWNRYILAGDKPSLYTYSAQRFDWVPSLAADFPTALQEETVGGETFWTTEVPLKADVEWSDGVAVTADDFVFTAQTALEMQLSGTWPSLVDPDYFDHAEAVDPYRLKLYFKQKPGLARWQFGLAFMPIMSLAYWEPVVTGARQGDDIIGQQKALYAHVPDNEPTAGGFGLQKWERGAFAEKAKNSDYFFADTMVTQYVSGAYTEAKPGGYEFEAYGEAGGNKALEYTVGPYAESTIYSIYGSQDAAVLALKKGDIDFMLNPLGLSRGLQMQLEGEDGLAVIENPSDGMRYLGFNFRKAPMDNLAFRQAVATLIDKEFITQTVLQGVAFPMYGTVAEGNLAWYNPHVTQIGKDMSRGERIARVIELLKGAGFTWETEPRVSEDGKFVEQRGEGLKMPNGQPAPSLTILAPSPGYDPLRSTFAIWIERWLNEAGIPVHADLTGFNVIVDKVFDQQDFDMWILGWGLGLYPEHLESFFHSRHSRLEGHNPGGYSNPDYDRLADEFLAETDIEAARELVFEMQAFLAEDLPYVTLFDTPLVEAYRSDRVEYPYTHSLGGLQDVSGMTTLVQFK